MSEHDRQISGQPPGRISFSRCNILAQENCTVVLQGTLSMLEEWNIYPRKPNEAFKDEMAVSSIDKTCGAYIPISNSFLYEWSEKLECFGC